MLHREVVCRQPRRFARTMLAAVALFVSLIALLGSFTDRSCRGCESKASKTRIKVSRYAFEAFPSWSAQHPGTPCPARLQDLSEYMFDDDERDAWGQPMYVLCGPDLPADARGVAVISAGEDGRFGTCDDVQSWNPKHTCD
jgi:hypothetical protein